MTEPLDPSDPTVIQVTAALRAGGFAVRDLTTCGHCGQTDDHPKVQILGLDEPHHNDCLPHRYRQAVVESSPAAAAIVEACEGGLRGDDLLAFITTDTEGATS